MILGTELTFAFTSNRVVDCVNKNATTDAFVPRLGASYVAETSRERREKDPSRWPLVPAFAHAATVRRQLTNAYLGKRAKLTIGIFFEVCLDQRGIVALTN